MLQLICNCPAITRVYCFRYKLYMQCDMYYKMQDEFIRQLLSEAAAAESYRKGCYQNKINYIVRRLHR